MTVHVCAGARQVEGQYICLKQNFANVCQKRGEHRIYWLKRVGELEHSEDKREREFWEGLPEVSFASSR